IWWDDDVIPRHSVHHLYIKEVEVDRMRIDAVVRDAPDLGSIRGAAYGRYVEVALRQVGRIDEFGGRVDKWIECDILCTRRWGLGFHTEIGLHSAKFIEGRRVHFVVDRLGLERQGQLATRWVKQRIETKLRCVVDADKPIALEEWAAGHI